MAAAKCSTLGCECGCHRARVRQAPTTWTRERDAFVSDALSRGQVLRVIAAGLGVTEESVRWRLRQLDRSTREGWRSRVEVVRVLGVPRRSVDRWMRSGQLRVARHGTRWTRVTDADLRAFVEQQAGVLFDADGVADPALRRFAETSAIVNRRRAAS
jgi:hypothetical protein